MVLNSESQFSYTAKKCLKNQSDLLLNHHWRVEFVDSCLLLRYKFKSQSSQQNLKDTRRFHFLRQGLIHYVSMPTDEIGIEITFDVWTVAVKISLIYSLAL